MKHLKKLILTFALLLTVSFAFAGNEVEKNSVGEVEETVTVELAEADLIQITEFSEIITISEEQYNNPALCFAIGNIIFDMFGVSAKSVALANAACKLL